MARLRGQEGVAARALEFAVLTAARTSEVLGAVWPEFDLEAATWLVPAERMKASGKDKPEPKQGEGSKPEPKEGEPKEGREARCRRRGEGVQAGGGRCAVVP